MRAILWSATISVTLMAVACGHSIMPSEQGEFGGVAAPTVAQTGKSPTNWTFFSPSGAEATGEITASNSYLLWYVIYGSQVPQVCKINMSGTSTCLVNSTGYIPRGLSVGPDGNIWIGASQAVGRVEPSGAITLFSINANAQSTVAGPDGNVWIAITGAHDGVIKMSTSGEVLAECDLPNLGVYPERITAGPDGNLWMTATDNNFPGEVIKVSTSCVFTQYQDTVLGGQPFDIATGPDGNLWVTEFNQPASPYINEIAKVSTSGTFTFYDVPLPKGLMGQPDWITPGPNGLMWFTENAVNASGRTLTGSWIFNVSPKGKFTAYATPDGGSLAGVAAGRDGNIWTSDTAGSTGRVAVLIRRVLSVTPSSLDMTVGEKSSLCVSETDFTGSWTSSSSNSTVATTAPEASKYMFTVRAVKPGNATITIKDGIGNSFAVSVNVK
jgi:streptogramin lyase